MLVAGESLEFYDNFNRADSTDIGNGWFEKGESVEDSFFIRNNEVVGEDGNFIYFDKLVTRPQGEDIADVEFSLEFTREDPNAPLVDLGRFAQIHGRISRDTVDETAVERIEAGEARRYLRSNPIRGARIPLQMRKKREDPFARILPLPDLISKWSYLLKILKIMFSSRPGMP